MTLNETFQVLGLLAANGILIATMVQMWGPKIRKSLRRDGADPPKACRYCEATAHKSVDCPREKYWCELHGGYHAVEQWKGRCIPERVPPRPVQVPAPQVQGEAHALEVAINRRGIRVRFVGRKASRR